MTLVKQTGSPAEEFSKLQEAVSNLRDNLIEAAASY
jgi:MarR family transcriptional regulator, organic hydroperoxide resistance regulator